MTRVHVAWGAGRLPSFPGWPALDQDQPATRKYLRDLHKVFDDAGGAR